MFKFDVEKIKAKLNAAKENAENARNKKKRDIHSDPLVKVESAGDYEFRAVPYVHHKDFISDPFPERFYHFGIPGNAIFYCPSMNSGRKEKCAVCDFVWERLKETKGTDEVKKWRKFLPQKRVWIPGILRGREDEGLKYFPLSTHEDKMGKHHEKLFKYLQDKFTYCMLDPEEGYDLVLQYEEYDENKSRTLNGAKFGFSGLDLARGSTPISDNPEETWAEIEKTMKNVDKDLERYEIKTSADAEKVLLEWGTREEKKEKSVKANKPVDSSKDDDGAMVDGKGDEQEVSDDDKPVVVEKTSATPADNEDRKAKALRMLGRK